MFNICKKCGQKFEVAKNHSNQLYCGSQLLKLGCSYINSLDKHRDYYIKNKLKITEKVKTYYANNKAEIKGRMRAYSIKNKNKIQEKHQEYYTKTREKILQEKKEYHLKVKYDLTPQKYQEMLEAQNGVCAICGGINNTSKRTKLYVDHCHDSNTVRGLLCDSCNRGLGNFKDNMSNLSKAIQYLTKWEEL